MSWRAVPVTWKTSGRSSPAPHPLPQPWATSAVTQRNGFFSAIMRRTTALPMSASVFESTSSVVPARRFRSRSSVHVGRYERRSGSLRPYEVA